MRDAHIGIIHPRLSRFTVDRIKSLSLKVLETHKSKFGKDFADNKKALNQIAIVRSKGLKNEIAGHITNIIKREQIEEEAKLARIKAAQAEEAEQKAMADAEKKRADSKEESADTTPEVQADSSDTVSEVQADSSDTVSEVQADVQDPIPAETLDSKAEPFKPE